MALQSIIDVNVDFYDKRHVLINAKQDDKNSRFLSVTCYNHGEIYHLNAGEHSAYVRYKKPDNNGVFNFCEINNKGKILIELTEQMLSTDGISYADLVIVNKGSANINAETGEITTINNASVLSSMILCIDVTESPVKNSDIESSYEFDGLNAALGRAEAEYTDVIRLAKSYAVGNAGGIRNNEDIDNSKYYYEKCLRSVNDTTINESSTITNAANAASSAAEAERNKNVILSVLNGLNSGFIPMGTITFEELATIDKATGFVYNIRNDFVTNSSFAEGAGQSYTAGTNVFCRADGLWDCLGGSASTAATVDEVIQYLNLNV